MFQKNLGTLRFLRLTNSLFTAKKTSKIYVWLAIDRNRNEVVNIEISRERNYSAYLALALRLEEKYKIKILF